MDTKRKPKQAAQRRIVAYVRISRAREDETSTKTQEAAIRAYCAVHGWQIVDVIVEPGRSAFKSTRSSRPGFQKAMQLITTGAADTFVVWKLDRAARNTLDLLKFVREELATYDAEFVSVTEHFDTTSPMGRAMMTIVAALAELESAQKAERALEWHEGRRAAKRAPTGPPALGYQRQVDEDDNPIPNTLVLDPIVAPIVQEAARRVLNGESLSAILRWMETAGVTISRPGLLSVLQSPTLVGLLSMEPLTGDNGERYVADVSTLVEGDWDPVLDRDTWDRLRLILRDSDRRSNTTNVMRHPLRPLLRCYCGGGMRRQGDKRQYQSARYVCEVPKCGNGITQDPVDEAVSAAMLAHLDDSAWRSLRASGAASGPDPKKIEADLAKMWKLVIGGSLDMEEYAEAKVRWRGELAAAASGAFDLPDVASVREAWPSFDPAQQHLVYRRAIKSLVIKRATRRGRGVDLARIDLVLVD